MYRNLEAELARKGMTKKDLALKIGMNQGTLSRKAAGLSDFTWAEILQIKEIVAPGMPAEYLFQRETGCEQGLI